MVLDTSQLSMFATNRKVPSSVNVPVIASGGAGNIEHLFEGIEQGEADAVLVASIFHYGEYTIEETKDYLINKGIIIRK